MKLFKYLIIILPLLLINGVAFGQVGTGEIILDNVTNVIGGDSVEVSKPIRFTLRWRYTSGTEKVNNVTNGFQIYEKNGGDFWPITYDILDWGWQSYFLQSFMNPFSVDGVGRDTIGFGFIDVLGTLGIPVGFDTLVYYIETGSDNAGDTICIDSTWYPPGGTWLWSLPGGGTKTFQPNWAGPYCFHVEGPSDIKDITDGALPETFTLSQNYPNPFNPTTQIAFDIPVKSDVSLTVYNILGQKVTTLVDREMAAGSYVVDWNGKSDGGTEVASGVYFYKIETDNYVDTKKMMLVR